MGKAKTPDLAFTVRLARRILADRNPDINPLLLESLDKAASALEAVRLARHILADRNPDINPLLLESLDKAASALEAFKNHSCFGELNRLRSLRLSPERRSEIARLAVTTRWARVRAQSEAKEKTDANN